jgi:hypothetical protein
MKFTSMGYVIECEKHLHMDHCSKILLFKDTSFRSDCYTDLEERFFSVVDVVAALADSANPTAYLKTIRKRDEQLSVYVGTNCPEVAMQSAKGKLRKTMVATTQQLLGIIQSIPSKNTEPPSCRTRSYRPNKRC